MSSDFRLALGTLTLFINIIFSSLIIWSAAWLSVAAPVVILSVAAAVFYIYYYIKLLKTKNIRYLVWTVCFTLFLVALGLWVQYYN